MQKIWQIGSFLLEGFVEHKPLISEEFIVSKLTLSFPKSVLGLANLIVAELTDPQHVRINGADNFFSLAK